MIKINIHEAKTHLSHHLEHLSEVGVIVLCKRNLPIAEIRPIAPLSTSLRPIGLEKGRFEISPDFFSPLPDEVLAGFANPQ